MARIEMCALKIRRKGGVIFFVSDSLGVPLLSFRQANRLRDIFSESLRNFDIPLVPALEGGVFDNLFDGLIRL